MRSSTERTPHDARLEFFPFGDEWRRHQRGEIAIALNQGLADCINLGLQCRQSYRSLPHDDSLGVRRLAVQIAQELDLFADLIGERVLIVGGNPEGTVRAVAFRSRLATYDLRTRTPEDLADTLAQAIAQFVQHARSSTRDITELSDRESADVLERVARVMETRWTLLEATLAGVAWLGP